MSKDYDPPWRLDPFQNIKAVGWGLNTFYIVVHGFVYPPFWPPNADFELNLSATGGIGKVVLNMNAPYINQIDGTIGSWDAAMVVEVKLDLSKESILAFRLNYNQPLVSASVMLFVKSGHTLFPAADIVIKQQIPLLGSYPPTYGPWNWEGASYSEMILDVGTSWEDSTEPGSFNVWIGNRQFLKLDEEAIRDKLEQGPNFKVPSRLKMPLIWLDHSQISYRYRPKNAKKVGGFDGDHITEEWQFWRDSGPPPILQNGFGEYMGEFPVADVPVTPVPVP